MTANRAGKTIGVRFVLAIAAVFLLASRAPTWATTWIVDGTGGGDFLGIQDAIDNIGVQAGDTIFVRAGTYNGAISVTKSLTLQCAGPDVVTIRNDLGDTIQVLTAVSVKISGCTVTGARYGVLTGGGASVTVTNVVAVANRDGIHVYEGTNSIAVRNSVLAFNRDDGWQDEDAWDCISSELIENTVIVSNGRCGIADDDCDPDLAYNNVRDNVTDYCGTGQGDHPLYDPEIPGTVVPGFVDSDRGDFRLAANSANRNRGMPTAADLDPDGTRNDIGAFGGPDAAGFFPSDDLGPTVRELTISPSSVPQGGEVGLHATGEVNTR